VSVQYVIHRLNYHCDKMLQFCGNWQCEIDMWLFSDGLNWAMMPIMNHLFNIYWYWQLLGMTPEILYGRFCHCIIDPISTGVVSIC